MNQGQTPVNPPYQRDMDHTIPQVALEDLTAHARLKVGEWRIRSACIRSRKMLRCWFMHLDEDLHEKLPAVRLMKGGG